jgi:hypothetical protein
MNSSSLSAPPDQRALKTFNSAKVKKTPLRERNLKSEISPSGSVKAFDKCLPGAATPTKEVNFCFGCRIFSNTLVYPPIHAWGHVHIMRLICVVVVVLVVVVGVWSMYITCMYVSIPKNHCGRHPYSHDRIN